MQHIQKLSVKTQIYTLGTKVYRMQLRRSKLVSLLPEGTALDSYS